ncbi:MAG: ComEC/Rec2 family competence protein [Pirellulales bacterium]|nr:ComEC/Rec2 family competence protein [Pirellulales bacterium]
MSSTGARPSTEPPLTPRYQPLVIVFLAVVGGILIDRYVPLSIGFWGILGVSAFAAWWFLRRKNWDRPAGAAILCAVAALAGVWHHCRWCLFADDDLGNYAQTAKQPGCLQARVLRGPRPLPPPPTDTVFPVYFEPGYRLQVEALALRDRVEWIPISGRVDLVVRGETPPAVEAGDRIRIFGQLSAPSPAMNPGEFDRAAYARSRRVRAQIQSQMPACLSVLPSGGSWNPIRLLERLRRRSAEVLESRLAPRQSELAAAILLGEREQLDFQRTGAFMTTGTIHLLSISGLHVGILAGLLLWLMRRCPLPRGLGLVLVAAVTGAYALLVDVEPPVVRATVLVLLTCASLWLYRPLFSYNTLAAAALVVLTLNPSDLFHVGAQLSFLSVGAIIWVQQRRNASPRMSTLQEMIERNLPPVSRLFHRGIRCFGNIFLVGGVLWLMVTPLVMSSFHVCSPVALVLSPILWIPMTLGLLSGFLLLFCHACFPPLAGVCAEFCNLNLWAIEGAVRLAQRLPLSHSWVAGPPGWWLAGFYGAIFLAVVLPRRPPRRWCIALLSTWIAVGMAASLASKKDAPLQCTFLAVGHGTAVVVELPDERTLLYDAGQLGAPHRAANVVSGFLWSRGITHLDAVVLSHPDADHYNALPTLADRFSVGVVYVSPIMFEGPSSTLHALHDYLERRGVPIRKIWAGDRLDGGSACRLEVLHPPRRCLPTDDNANSIVLEVDYQGRRLLLPGDLEPPGLETLLNDPPVDCSVLMAPHHGSKKSNSPPLARWCRPRWVVLSGDGRWSTAEIDVTYRAVGGQTLHTSRSGAIQFFFRPEGTQIKTFRFGLNSF